VKLAVLGGSFNPIHIGHLCLADAALQAFRFDQLLLVPANVSPFKVPGKMPSPAQDTPAMASNADRLDMILASITGDARLTVDEVELNRGGISYTIDTLKEIIDRYRPKEKISLILGDDLAADFSQWKDAEKIANMADIVIARRGGGGDVFPFPHKKLDNEVMAVSSAMVRERIAAGKAWRYLVPRGARILIEERSLYGAAPAEKDLSLIARVEDAVRQTLSAKRFIHSRNTAFLARRLALRYGMDPCAAYLAGIAHDMAKTLEPGLFHGRGAAVLLEKWFDIHNKDILEAVEFHTTGKPGMGNLAKAVYIADKIEFSRKDVEGLFREEALNPETELDGLFYAVLEDNVRWLEEEKKIKASEETRQLLAEERRMNEVKDAKIISV
jgi:nicotinate-nucleotide adenylyltransferase